MPDVVSLLASGGVEGVLAALGMIILVAPWAFILTGKLVPRSLLERADRDRDAAVAAAERALDAIAPMSDRVSDIAEGMKTFDRFLRDLPPPGGSRGGQGRGR